MEKNKQDYTLREWINAIVEAYQHSQLFKLAKLYVYGVKHGYNILVDGKNAEELENLCKLTDTQVDELGEKLE